MAENLAGVSLAWVERDGANGMEKLGAGALGLVCPPCHSHTPATPYFLQVGWG